MELRVTPAVEAHQPAHGEPHIEGHVRHVEDRDDAASGKKQRLELGLDVDPEPPLESHDPLRVARGLAPTLVVGDEVPNGEIDGVDAEADGGLAPPREPLSHPPLPIAADILIDAWGPRGGAHSSGS